MLGLRQAMCLVSRALEVRREVLADPKDKDRAKVASEVLAHVLGNPQPAIMRAPFLARASRQITRCSGARSPSA
jgi:hypothetical protein